MKLGIEDRVAVVGGSSAGIGRAVARGLAAEGVRVLVTGRSADRVEATVQALRDQVGDRVAGVAVDLSEADGPQRAVDAARRSFGEVDMVVANAGGPPSMAAVSASAEDLEAASRLLLLPVQRLMSAVLPGMRERGWGRFVAITSVAVRQPQPGLVLSNALRAAVTGYLKSVSDEVGADGVTVNTVCPGYTNTERLGELATALAEREGGDAGEILQSWAEHAPLGRLLHPEEVAAATVFLCSEPAAGITGVAMPVDGGFSRGLL